MNLIFLDFDGVLTSKNNGTYFCSDVSKYKYSTEHINRLINLCNETNSKIVIASNWRRFADDGSWTMRTTGEVFKNPLPKLRWILGNLIIDTLPPDRHIRKSDALKLWFEKNPGEYNYVIFDDDLRENYQISKYKDHFIHVNVDTGLSDSDCQKAKNILRGVNNGQ